MAQNSTVQLALQADPVPANRECETTVSGFLKAVEDFVKITGGSSTAPGSPLESLNNVAAQALETANSAFSTANQALGAIPARRTSGGVFDIPASDSTLPIAWSPPMESAEFEVRATIHMTSVSAPHTFFGWSVIEGSRTPSSVQLYLDNIPAGSKLSWVVEAL